MKAGIIILVLLLVGSLVSATAGAQTLDLSTGFARITYSSVCTRNAAKIQKVISASHYLLYGGYVKELREKDTLGAQIVQPCAETDPRAKAMFEQSTKNIAEYDQICDPRRYTTNCEPLAKQHLPPGELESSLNFMALFRSEAAKALNDPNYSSDLGIIKGDPSPGVSKASSAPAPAAAAPDDPNCPGHGQNLAQANEEIAKIDEALANYNKEVPEDSTAVTPALQAVMWGTSKEAEIIKKYCHLPSFLDRMESLNAAYQSALNACRQISSSPETECVAVLPDSTAFDSKMLEIPVPKPISSPGNLTFNTTRATDTTAGSGESTAPPGKQGNRSTRAGSSSSQPAAAKQQKQHGPQNASSCIVEENARLVNTCGYDVEMAFCVENPQQTKNFFDNSKAFECPNGGLSTVAAGKAEPNVLHGHLQWFACSEVDIATMKSRYTNGAGYEGSCY